MHSETHLWKSPDLARGFDIKSNHAALDEHVITPAVRQIANEIVSSYLSQLKPIPSEIRTGQPKEGWDSVVRFTESWDRVFPFKTVQSQIGIVSEPNPEFESVGLLVFSRDCPDNSFSVDVHQKVNVTSSGQYITALIEVTIPDESVFKTEWFRLGSKKKNFRVEFLLRPCDVPAVEKAFGHKLKPILWPKP